jgi:dihydroxyacetone kinase phosphoprotein-dependent L subunit
MSFVMIDVNTFGELCSFLRERFEQNRDYLNELDSQIGDGDHGYTMERAFRAVENAVEGNFSDMGSCFDAAAEALAEGTGGAIGPLLAGLFAEGGLVFRSKADIDPDGFEQFLRGGLQAVREIGEAKEGDKTMVDALAPAVRALEEKQGAALIEMFDAAAEAAQKGAEATQEMIASHGRARFLSERALQHQDPGATSIALILKSVHDFECGERAQTERTVGEVSLSPPCGKLINHPSDLIREDNQGLVLVYPDLVEQTEGGVLIRAKLKKEGKVGLAIGHGGGHTPSMGGFIGPGLLDADVYGPIFTCASGVRIAQAIKLADRGAGVVLLVSNHSGDVLNARLALRRARGLSIKVEPVVLGDDIATAPRDKLEERRGLGGLLFALKIGGAASELGEGLAKVVEVMHKTNRRTATLSVAVRPPTHPVSGDPLFELPVGQIEIGTGVHGEVGVYRGPHLLADQIVDMLVARLVDDLSGFPEKNLLVFVNGAGGTSRTELHLVYRRVHLELTKLGYSVEAGVVDSFFTTQEMGGFSLSLCAVDDELLRYWHEPASGPCFRWPYS